MVKKYLINRETIKRNLKIFPNKTKNLSKDIPHFDIEFDRDMYQMRQHKRLRRQFALQNKQSKTIQKTFFVWEFDRVCGFLERQYLIFVGTEVQYSTEI